MPRGGSKKRSHEWHMQNARTRIEEMSMPEPNSGCWLWLKTLDKRGYGKLGTAMGKVVAAHRLSFEAYVCAPGKLLVLHHCDTPACVNPQHLYAGTQKDNIRDCITRGRFRPRGVLWGG